MSSKTSDTIYNTLLKIFPTYKEFNALTDCVTNLTNIVSEQQIEIKKLKELYKNDRDQSSKILQ